MSRNFHAHPWFWGASFGLVLSAVVVVWVLLNANGHTPPEAPVLVANEPNVVVPSPGPSSIKSVVAIQEPPQLSLLEFPPGSVEKECGLNAYVPYHSLDASNPKPWPKSPYDTNGALVALEESAECRTALETHISTINPYLWGENLFNGKQRLAFIELDNPLTFGRIFADPVGDLSRVQDALSRPECLLEPTETNWELKASCHADAFLNYALFSRYCHYDGVWERSRTYYWEEDNPTPEQDRFMWKQRLEGAWVEEKCEELNTVPEFTEHNPELRALLLSLGVPVGVLKKSKGVVSSLIEYAARLGDEAAGLTAGSMPSYGIFYHDEGYKYGRLAQLVNVDTWNEFARKEAPSTDRFLRTFEMLARVASRKADPRDEFKFDWEWTVRHLCEPPFEKVILLVRPEPEFMPPPEPIQSCQEVVHEIRQSGTTFRPLIDVLDKFEQVALELEVYE